MYRPFLVSCVACFTAFAAVADEPGDAVAAAVTETPVSAEGDAVVETEVQAEAEPEVALTPFEQWEADKTQVFDAADIDLADFQWLARPVVVFANTDANPAFEEQLARLEADIADLVERDVILIVDTDPEAESALRTKLRPRGFMLTLIGKDGQVKLRKPSPWSVRELTRSIDKMPLRQQEIRERR